MQFSQLSCSDVNLQTGAGTIGPKRSPLGFSADPGGLPLYKNGTVVGGIGVIADGIYTVDLNIIDVDVDLDELIAIAGGSGLPARRPTVAPITSPSTAARCATSIRRRWPAIPPRRPRLRSSITSQECWSMSLLRRKSDCGGRGVWDARVGHPSID